MALLIEQSVSFLTSIGASQISVQGIHREIKPHNIHLHFLVHLQVEPIQQQILPQPCCWLCTPDMISTLFLSHRQAVYQ